MIEIQGLGKYYGDHKVLSDISLSVGKGDVFGIVGHSGAGKSTLLRCLNGLEGYSEGSVRVKGQEVKELDDAGLKRLRRDMGMIFQNFNLMNRKNVFENIMFPLKVWGTPKAEAEARVDELLELVGLSAKRNEKVRNLSGGQKQRVGIARALALNPEILLCDEATSALDPKTTISILELLMDINRKLNVTIIAVTHQMEVVKMICNKVIILDGGRVVDSGDTDKLFLAPGPELRKLITDDYAVIPQGTNIRLMFPREIANEGIVAKMARELDIDFSIVGGRIEKYRDTVMGFLIVHVGDEDVPRIEKWLKENKMFWEVMDDGR
ncbi:methionine ABC transporter ATP-binding protein [Cloacibacillus sp. An23]|uniref:methionine ABC transporter ATP-binding protein n=1 Tax=Cloacibacillus sp. An23 TaxID=1965591 RepID=UPI000B374491|nr:methionine ABC transporter ATP-binding protein [Cloacibacillus sp. An23]OUO94372.1 methionine ABC transporter ATP-binding protein [Cloacibacillus sp. An23]